MSTATTEKTSTKRTFPTIDLDDVRKPAYAWVGIADFAYEQAKEVPSDVQARTRSARARARKLQDNVPTQVKDVQTQVKELPTTIREFPTKVKELPTTVKDLPSKANGLRRDVRSSAATRVEKASDRANARYTDLATRGEKLVGQIRRQKATQDAIAEGKRAVQKAEAAANNAKRSAKAAAKAGQNAASKLG